MVLALCAGPVAGQSVGGFSATGSMTTPRWKHTSTVLTDGRVLVTGGVIYGELPVLSSAETYDPLTGNFVTVGNMNTPRLEHTATLLADGKVLIVGGDDGFNGSLASAEVYDPVTSTFSRTGDMIAARRLHQAVLLTDGKVLIAGGSGHSEVLQSAETYDPATNRFGATGNMNSMWADTATLLANGMVLITKANPDVPIAPQVFQMAELYDPATGTFSVTGKMAEWHTGPTASLLLNGKVLIAGGDIGDGDLPSAQAEVYDPATGTFAAVSNMTAPREANTATLLPDGTVLMAGGHGGVPVGNGGFENLSSSELFDPGGHGFSPAANMVVGRDWLNANLLNDGRVLITGGNEYYGCCAGNRPTKGGTLSTAEIYTPAKLIPAAALLSLSSDGKGQGAIQHATTYQLVTADNPAVAGEAIVIYCVGLIDGSVIPPRVAIGGQVAQVLWFGNTPGYPGLNQINVLVPAGVAPGPGVAVRLNYLSRASNGVTIAVR
jgi:hypothetical protein